MLLPANECNQIDVYSTELGAHLVASWGILTKSSRNNFSVCVYMCWGEGAVSLEKGSSPTS